MADATLLYAVDNTADVNVVCQNDGVTRIVVQENYNSVTPPTADLLQKIPASAVSAIAIPKGTPAIFTPAGLVGLRNSFQKNMIVGTIRTSAGSITVQQVESMQV